MLPDDLFGKMFRLRATYFEVLSWDREKLARVWVYNRRQRIGGVQTMPLSLIQTAVETGVVQEVTRVAPSQMPYTFKES